MAHVHCIDNICCRAGINVSFIRTKCLFDIFFFVKNVENPIYFILLYSYWWWERNITDWPSLAETFKFRKLQKASLLFTDALIPVQRIVILLLLNRIKRNVSSPCAFIILRTRIFLGLLWFAKLSGALQLFWEQTCE